MPEQPDVLMLLRVPPMLLQDPSRSRRVKLTLNNLAPRVSATPRDAQGRQSQGLQSTRH